MPSAADKPAEPLAQIVIPTKVWALLAAVVHHGMSNLSSAENNKPARSSTVVITAQEFERYLES